MSDQPIGKCLDCGGFVYSEEFTHNFCSQECADKTVEYMEGK